MKAQKETKARRKLEEMMIQAKNREEEAKKVANFADLLKIASAAMTKASVVLQRDKMNARTMRMAGAKY